MLPHNCFEDVSTRAICVKTMTVYQTSKMKLLKIIEASDLFSWAHVEQLLYDNAYSMTSGVKPKQQRNPIYATEFC